MTFPDSNPGSAPARDIIVHVFGRTDVGRTREHNEDAFVVADLTTDNATLQPEVRTHQLGERGTLFMVADGMGGAAAGEIASAMATDVILAELRRIWLTAENPSADRFAMSLKSATEAANTRIHQYAVDHPEHRGMGTTATIAGLIGDSLILAQVGDSRAYLIRDGVARQITKDQSLIQKLVEAGELTPEEAEQSERRNIILQALGPESNIKTDITVQQVRKGDTLVLCSDGLSGQVKPEQIAEAVNTTPDLTALCKRLIDLANENGGPDNITVVAARFEGAGLDSAATSDAVGHRQFRFSGEARATMPMSPGELAETTAEVVAPGSVDPNALTPVEAIEAIEITDLKLIVRQSGNKPPPAAISEKPTPRKNPAATTGSGPGPLVWAAIAIVLAVVGYFVIQGMGSAP
ncbi:MAG: Stp1/IreP family PP2C-type Ser/Thr phosphatase [Gemmatimonadetes bacterium]|nr:Stp1/IreP family PP2C-type Ser/Thr phosphatase [Gemmatimonadota bacterium]